MKQQMTKEQFKDWKEANEWFFQFLAKYVEDKSDQLAEIGAAVGSCPPDMVHDFAKQANGIMARCSAYQDIVDIEYETIFEQTDEETDV